MTALRCPDCGGRLADGVEFTATQRTRGEQYYIVADQDPTGDLVLDPCDNRIYDFIGPLEVECGYCMYKWTTRRPQRTEMRGLP